jgi:hypothetical protein
MELTEGGGIASTRVRSKRSADRPCVINRHGNETWRGPLGGSGRGVPAGCKRHCLQPSYRGFIPTVKTQDRPWHWSIVS